MAIVDGSLQLGYKDSAWFTANASLVLLVGQIVYLEQTGTYKLGDGVTQLSALTFLGGGGTVDVNTIGAAINGATSATPNDTDLVMSVDTSVAKKNTWTQIKAFLKTYFDTVYLAIVDFPAQFTTELSGKTTADLAPTTDLNYVTDAQLSHIDASVKGTLTTNYIPKATASDTIGNSQIFDDGSFVGIAEPSPTARLSVLTPDNLVSSFGVKIRQNVSGDDLFTIKGNGDSSFTNKTRLGVGDFVSSTARLGVQGISGASSTDYIFITYPYGGAYIPFAVQENGKILLQGLTASQIVETDSSKNLVSAAKGTAYNKNFGTTAGTVTEGGTALLITNNLSDLANPLTARNNLKEWDLIITTGNQTTTSNVAANITDLVSTTLTANKRYMVHGRIKVGCNNTGGVRFQITLPTGATMDVSLSGSQGSNTAYINTTITASATLSAAVQAFNGSSILRIDGEITMGGTAGSIQFGFASNTNTQTSTVYQQATSIMIKQID